MEAAQRNQVARVVQESITFPYADAGDRWIGEDAERPRTEFSAPVDKAEAAATGYVEGDGVVLRFAQFYASDASHTQLFARAFRWGLNPYVGDPDGYTSVIGMDAAGRAVVAALDVEPGIYNVADDDPPTRRELGRTVAAAIGRKRARTLPAGMVRRLNPAADVLMRSHRIDNRRFAAATGWRPDHAGGAGVAAAVAAVLGRA